jgi:23S rRNA (adenine2030-N6)-methyltransferase
MNYRHAFHAGNVGDVLKHVVLIALLDRLLVKPTPCFYLDTHAGRGRYDLQSDAATRSPEWQSGIRLLLEQEGERTPEVARYIELLGADGAATPQLYPGSPHLALAVLRPIDRIALIERHPEEHAALIDATPRRARLSMQCEDGYTSLKAYLPPKENRGLVLIDPPFETPTEFSDLSQALLSAVARWPNGIYCVWYPIKADSAHERLERELRNAALRRVLKLELTVHEPGTHVGLNGSGLMIINPPWQFDLRMQVVLPELHRALAPTGAGEARVEWIAQED